MAEILFHEKPGCAGNARQKAALIAAGHTLDVRDLLTTPWTPETLTPYLARLPVARWFNRAAPAVKNGEIDPDTLDVNVALGFLLANPLLIRRPLMRVGDRYVVGFEPEAVEWLLAGEGEDADAVRSVGEGCARANMPPCPKP